MSSSSDSEEFFDAEDDIAINKVARKGKRRDSTGAESNDEKFSTPVGKNDSHVFLRPADPKPITETSEKAATFEEGDSKKDFDKSEEEAKGSGVDKMMGRRRFRELRQRMQTEDDDIAVNNSPPDSQTSSVEGVYPTPSKTSHPFRIIEHDTLSLQSMTSLGRVGRILSGSADNASGILAPGTSPSVSNFRDAQMAAIHSASSKEDDTGSDKMSKSSSVVTLSGDVKESSNNDKSDQSSSQTNKSVLSHEPDVVASTKSNGKVVEAQDPTVKPIAPPRRKKKSKVQTSSDYVQSDNETLISVSTLPSPASTIESITKEFEHSLDIKSATKGQYVVKPQDEEKSKAEGPPPEEIERLEKMKSEPLSVNSSDKSNSPLGSISSNSIGRHSLGPHRISGSSPHGSKERRRSAGDQDLVSQLNMFVRTRTDSGKRLTDMEILEQVTVLNLDTGERVPLSIAEDKLPQCINPLSLHIMRLTSEYVSNASLEKEKESDEESVDSKMSSIPQDEDATVGRVRKKTEKLKRLFGTVKKTMDKAKPLAQELWHARHKEDAVDIIEDPTSTGEQQSIKVKASNSHKGPYEFYNLQHIQDLSDEHAGPVWCMKFSACGRLLATAGQDRVLRIWVLRDAFTYFQDMRTKYNTEKVSPTPSQESLVSQQSMEDPQVLANILNDESIKGPFMPKPFCTYSAHTSDLLDVAWSKNYFILSSSMDKTVRLWHISRKECLCCFQHIEFVTAIVFHPKDDRYFLSGSLDGKLRLWYIPDKKVAVWNEIEGKCKLITAANFCQNGQFAVVGSYDGRCIFYITDQLKYHTTIHVRSSRGKNRIGRKISGIEPMPGEDKILVTSNDSRIRLYDLRDLNISCKYKGYVNMSSQIKASFSPDGQYIVSGSENQCIYIWKTHHDYSKFSSVRRDRNYFWESVKAHSAVVNCAVFSPNPEVIIRSVEAREQMETKKLEAERSDGCSAVSEDITVDPLVEQRTKGCGGHVLVSADFTGCIKVFMNKTKPKHSSLPASALA